MNRVGNLFSAVLTEGGIIKKEEEAICSYGLELMLLAAVEFASILIIAAFVGNLFYTLLFFASFLPLRIYAGGYHADTRVRCYLVLLLVYGIFSSVMCLSPRVFLPIEIISAVATVSTVWKLAPIVHQNKTASAAERSVYRKLSIRIMVVETMLLFTGVFWNPENSFVFSFALGQFVAAISMLAAFVKNKRKEEK